MIGYTVEIKGLSEQLAKLNGYSAIADRRLTDAMQRSVVGLQSGIREEWPVFMGLSRNSIASSVAREGPGSIVGKVGSTMKDATYPAVIEFGRRAGAPPPPPGALDRWVELKKGVRGAQTARAAFLVGRKIAKEGIHGKFIFKRTFEAQRGQIESYFAIALQLIAEDLRNGR